MRCQRDSESIKGGFHSRLLFGKQLHNLYLNLILENDKNIFDILDCLIWSSRVLRIRTVTVFSGPNLVSMKK